MIFKTIFKKYLLLLAVFLLPLVGLHNESHADAALAQALQMARDGQYQEASVRLFQLSHSPRLQNRRMQIRYLLGLMLHEMQLNQIAAFQFIGVVRDGNNQYVRQSIERLSLAADALGDDTLLNYAISRVRVESFPSEHRDMLYFRIGEYQMRNNQFVPAARSFARVQISNHLYPSAKYQEGLAYALAKQPQQAVSIFNQLIQDRQNAGITDKVRVGAMIGRARALYQMQRWDESIEAYRSIPRDSEFWHDTLFESSWAMLRSGRFRSAMSNFHSHHSPYYEQAYLPESLLLRSIVYLYICKYDEMDKVLSLFESTYKPMYRQIDQMLQRVNDPLVYFNEMVRVIRDSKVDVESAEATSYSIPYVVAHRIMQEGDFQNSYSYIIKLLEERRRMAALPADWKSSALGGYANRILQTRTLKARQRAGRQVRAHLESIRAELFDLFEQEGFIRYEMINGQKEALKKQISGRTLPQTQVDAGARRDYYIQNGYEYWPFRGEYWLDELGNYHYVGTQSCD